MSLEYKDVSHSAPTVEDDKAPSSYLDVIASLHPDSSDPDWIVAAAAINGEPLTKKGRDNAISKMAKALCLLKPDVKDFVDKERIRTAKSPNESQDDEALVVGKKVFRYHGSDFHFDEALDKCARTLLWCNKKASLPIYSCIGKEPVMLRQTKEGGRQRFCLEPISKSAMNVELSESLTFIRVTDEGDDGRRGPVPDLVSDHVYHLAERYLPQAPEIAHTPLFLEDGKLIAEPGYHFDAENPHYLNILLMDSNLNMPEVPLEPTAEETQEAMAWLKIELLSDFPFCEFDINGNEKREPSEAHALAMIFTPFMRRMIQGRTPVFFIEKPTSGTGGTILGQLPMWLYDGEPGSVTRYSKNEEEMQKGLIAAVRSRQSHLFFDDVSEFNSRELLRAITQENISGRLLGANEIVTVPNRFNWVGSGNNTIIYDEMARRIAYIRMNSMTDDVSKRKFRHPDISGMTYERFLQANRGKAVRHILTCIQYWLTTGARPFSLRRLGSFEDWSAKVGGVLQACGIEGFLDIVSPQKTDQNTAINRSFFKAFRRKFGVDRVQLAGDVFEWAHSIQHDIITGNNDDQKRSRFTNHTLYMLHGKTYRVDADNLMMMRTVNEQLDMVYKLMVITEDEANVPQVT